MKLIEEIRRKRPKLGFRTDYKHSRTAAIHLFCIMCMGGNREEAKACECYDCPLWQFRPGSKNAIVPEGILPPKDEYNQLINRNISTKRIERGKQLGNTRKKAQRMPHMLPELKK